MHKTIELRTTPDVESDNRPTLSLSLLATSERAVDVVRDLEPHVDEIVVVVASVDHDLCRHIVLAFNALPQSKQRNLIVASPTTHPDLFTTDALYALYALHRGDPFAGETIPDNFVASPFCADRSSLRNLGLEHCTADWRLSLQDDETLLHPEFLLDLCIQLDNHKRDVAYGSHHAGPRNRLVARLSRNVPQIRYEGVARESLEGGVRPGIIEGHLTTRDAEWSPELDTRRDGEAFQALYAEARLKKWCIPASNLVHLARTAPSSMLTFREAAIMGYLEVSLYPEERAWASCLLGEMHETACDMTNACLSYESALAEHPSAKAALRLCRAEFGRARLAECVSAYDKSVENLATHNICDDGAVSAPSCMILVASSLHRLGRKDEAREVCDTLLKLYPDNRKIAELCRGIVGE